MKILTAIYAITGLAMLIYAVYLFLVGDLLAARNWLIAEIILGLPVTVPASIKLISEIAILFLTPPHK